MDLKRHPFLTAIGIAFVPLALVLLVSWARGGSPEAAAKLVGPGVIAAIGVGVQASLAATRWSIWGYVWRFALAWIAVFILVVVVNSTGSVPAGH
jgi:hypothetical protein